MTMEGKKKSVQHRNSLDQKYLVLNISGITYCLHRDIVFLQPSGLLVDLWKKSKSDDKRSTDLPKTIFRDKKSNRYLVQRSPDNFDIIFQYYVSGKLHIPSWVCRDTIVDEVKFWKIDPPVICQCSLDISREEKPKFRRFKKITTWKQFSMSAWTFLQHPKSSLKALIYAIVSMIFVGISIMNLIIGSVPAFQLCPPNATEVYSRKDLDKVKQTLETPLYKFNETLGKTNTTIDFQPGGVLRFFSNCLGSQKFEIIDMICTTWFTVELIFRFIVCPHKKTFFHSPLNWVDFLACFPFYVEILLWLFKVEHGILLPYKVDRVFNILKAVTTLRVLKVARYSEGLKILGKTLLKAQTELGMLCLFVSVSLLVFSSLVYELEKGVGSKFTSIPVSMWWTVVTLCTVGFGDIYPITIFGKLVASVACVIGIMLVAMPVSILAENFIDSYKVKQKYAISDFQAG